MPSTKTLKAYSSLPNFIDLDITEDLIERVAWHLCGSAELGRKDSHMLQKMLL
jgi:hypothetical protein